MDKRLERGSSPPLTLIRVNMMDELLPEAISKTSFGFFCFV